VSSMFFVVKIKNPILRSASAKYDPNLEKHPKNLLSRRLVRHNPWRRRNDLSSDRVKRQTR
jgi:hypothetical protein